MKLKRKICHLSNNTVVTTVMSNFGLYKAFDEQGIGYAKTAVGDKYVYEYMAKNGCRVGGEQSGHIIFSKYASTGDGMAGFVLKNTLSDNGGVTRGICKMDEGNNLTEVVETKNIVKTATGAEADGVAVDVNSLVSMNMCGD